MAIFHIFDYFQNGEIFIMFEKMMEYFEKIKLIVNPRLLKENRTLHKVKFQSR